MFDDAFILLFVITGANIGRIIGICKFFWGGIFWAEGDFFCGEGKKGGMRGAYFRSAEDPGLRFLSEL
jgi:hypothetical protein